MVILKKQSGRGYRVDSRQGEVNQVHAKAVGLHRQYVVAIKKRKGRILQTTKYKIRV